MVEKRVVEKCWKRVFDRSVGEERREAFDKGLVQGCRRRVL